MLNFLLLWDKSWEKMNFFPGKLNCFNIFNSFLGLAMFSFSSFSLFELNFGLCFVSYISSSVFNFVEINLFHSLCRLSLVMFFALAVLKGAMVLTTKSRLVMKSLYAVAALSKFSSFRCKSFCRVSF